MLFARERGCGAGEGRDPALADVHGLGGEGEDVVEEGLDHAGGGGAEVALDVSAEGRQVDGGGVEGAQISDVRDQLTFMLVSIGTGWVGMG